MFPSADGGGCSTGNRQRAEKLAARKEVIASADLPDLRRTPARTLAVLFLAGGLSLAIVPTLFAGSSAAGEGGPPPAETEDPLSGVVLELAGGCRLEWKQDENMDGGAGLLTLVVEGAPTLLAEGASVPAVSPNRKRLAYLEPLAWEVIGQAYLYDIETGQKRVIVSFDALPGQCTPKELLWLDDRYLLVLIGHAYGTITRGGELHLFDTSTGQLRRFVNPPQGHEIFDLRTHGSAIVFKLFDSYNEVVVGQRELACDLLLSAAARGRTIMLP